MGKVKATTKVVTKSAKKIRLRVIEGGVQNPSLKTALQDRYQVFFENASDAMLIVELASGTVLEANTATLEMTGHLREELLGQPIAIFAPKTRDTSLIRSGNPLSMLQFENSGFFEDVLVGRKDGYCRFVTMSVRVADGLSMCVIRDVTEKKKLECDLITKHAELNQAYVDLEKANANLNSSYYTL